MVVVVEVKGRLGGVYLLHCPMPDDNPHLHCVLLCTGGDNFHRQNTAPGVAFLMMMKTVDWDLDNVVDDVDVALGTVADVAGIDE
jgi:hypothetical protein